MVTRLLTYLGRILRTNWATFGEENRNIPRAPLLESSWQAPLLLSTLRATCLTASLRLKPWPINVTMVSSPVSLPAVSILLPNNLTLLIEQLLNLDISVLLTPWIGRKLKYLVGSLLCALGAIMTVEVRTEVVPGRLSNFRMLLTISGQARTKL